MFWISPLFLLVCEPKYVQYPLNGYGSSCRAHDDDFLPECTGNTRAGYCSKKWTYVENPEECGGPGKWGAHESVYFPGFDLYYSYSYHYKYPYYHYDCW